LRAESTASLRSLDPADVPADLLELDQKNRWISQVFETLVKVDERGEPQPWLATSWTHDAPRKRWLFTARTKVMLHNQTPWSPPGGVVEVPDDRPIEQILRDLARPRNAIVVRAPDGSLLGTGPFKIQSFTAKAAALAAHDDYWGGRPFLNRIEVQFGKSLADQEADFDTGKADVVAVPVTSVRARRQKGIQVSTSQPAETLALVFDPRVPDKAREAMMLTMDRTTISSVVLQRQADPSAALLPGWMSGYAFVFPQNRDVGRAKQLLGGPVSLSFFYDKQDPVLRVVGDRVSVNASEAAITLRPASGATDVRLVRLPVTSPDPWAALADLAGALRTTLPSILPNWYEGERALLRNNLVLPLAQVPQAWALSSGVRDWPSSGSTLADVWLDGSKK
jgi:hypothetical protein